MLVRKVIRKVDTEFKYRIGFYKVRGLPKFFCIGKNKTGTTSLAKAFRDLGFVVGNQRKAEILAHRYYFQDEFRPIIKYVHSAQVFQDVPFSWPETYKHLDDAFPSSKFILSVRDSAEQWYRSLTRFHAKKFGLDGRIPTYEDLEKAGYVRQGFMVNSIRVHGTTKNDPYNKTAMISAYENYIRDVREYFKGRPDDLLIINLKEPGSYKNFLAFVGAHSEQTEFPWENRT